MAVPEARVLRAKALYGMLPRVGEVNSNEK
jgi:hypothetical protein